MQRMATIGMLAAAFTVGGCQQNQTADFDDQAPPPDPIGYDDYDDGQAFDQFEQPDAQPGAVADPQPLGPPEAQAQPQPAATHEVQEGDTLWSIAEQHYGDGQRWRDIADYNNINDPADLRAGQQLELPQ